MKRQSVVWKIVVGVLLLTGINASRNEPPVVGPEAYVQGYYGGRTAFTILGVYLLIAGIRGRVPKEGPRGH